MKQKEEEASIVRQILRSEITWLVFIVGGIWAFVQTVILPINTIQSQLASIQTTLGLDKDRLQTIEQDHKDLERCVRFRS